ncbi:hypothetical protein LQ948_11085 [Jiella sp. MQZ9-1]|uniref:Uncharacterized protein n=1 Tax=Jiella flava TaxID=2816857 RepID=A0A939JW02_9HYPH|nr:hypothetical protein [Jiella flava]MBO0662527.1 hypothetical protein [Jiella flava]MCD2471752.1 hypothetical protein [Jiella flava]
MTVNILVVLVAIAAAAILLAPTLRASTRWRATVTPLASIIGSGFLVSVPLLARSVGDFAIVAMAGLIAASFGIGAVLRFNIAHVEPLLADPAKAAPFRLTVGLERLSHFVLAFAYFVSVAYYLVLLGNFLLKGVGIESAFGAKLVATAILGSLGILGLVKGLGMLENIEEYTVGLNLAVIAALLAGLAFDNGAALLAGTWHLTGGAPQPSFDTLRMVLGLLIVVQGFETSRFMGDEFDAPTRIGTMRNAQLIAGAVYLVFFALVTTLFGDLGEDEGVAAIVGLVSHVAPILPLLLVVSAVASQFSASVADSVGGAGLIEGITSGRLTSHVTYPLIAGVAIAVTWGTDVFRLVTLASQAFALFYCVQCGVAVTLVWCDRRAAHRTTRLALFSVAALFCLAVTVLGIPSG